MTTRNSNQIQSICRKLLNNEYSPVALQLSSIDEFQRFYSTFVNLTKNIPNVAFVNLETIVKAQFSDISPQHFDILTDKPLSEKDFSFAEKKTWYGANSNLQGFGQFLVSEIRENWQKIAPIFLLSFLLLALANSDTLYDIVATLLIQSGTVFLSVFLIFTVSQSHILHRDKSLFQSGILQKYYSDDRNVILMGILTIALTFFSQMLIENISNFTSSTNIDWVIIFGRLLKGLSASLVISLLFNTFFIVANYYLDRTRDVLERDLASELLHEDYQRFSKTT
ncbi:hypothetical protein [Candidatus Leptofilum sp.]|uniref:hypothetical protein n=1 Tax=Candidatus Leptofilum sp. TaxID=3241576 RepID=UPI003B5A01A4